MVHEQENSNEVTPEIDVRSANPDDAQELAVLYRETWRATYPNTEYGITREDIEEKTKNWGTPEDIQKRRERIQNSDEYVYNIVAELNGRIVGNSVFVRTSEEYNKLATMYVHPEHHGLGAGLALAREGLQWLDSEKPIALEVAKYNKRAIEFYKKLGFEIAGNGRSPAADLPSGITVPEYRMVKSAHNT